jgi:threonine synthase
MGKFLGYRCSLCNREYLPDQITYLCPEDGGNVDVVLDYSEIQTHVSPGSVIESDDHSLWRYLSLLPVDNPGYLGTPLRQVGYTPMYLAERLTRVWGLDKVWIKDESRNPTASFKDRASAVVVARAKQIESDVVVTASTGNAGAALAGMSAAVGQKAVIFAPRTAPPAKIAQLLIYNAQVILVAGTYDDAFDLTVQAAREFGWYCRNTGYNPFTVEGKKTAAYEVWEWWRRHSDWISHPEKLAIFVSVGDGNIISGLHKGFKDLVELGWLAKMPRIFGVQAEGSAAIANAFDAGREMIVPVSAQTLADSISVDMPRDGIRAVRAVKDTGGCYLRVSDEEIIRAIAELGKIGIFAEPAGAAGYAGLQKAAQQSRINVDDIVVVINTGSGLKDVRAAMQAVNEAPVIEPTLTALKRMLSKSI